jgi:hypothetical protein
MVTMVASVLFACVVRFNSVADGRFVERAALDEGESSVKHNP